ncbi:hypothetical protein GEMRC1_011743 [Eukaryota sp. GEM-RC1]
MNLRSSYDDSHQYTPRLSSKSKQMLSKKPRIPIYERAVVELQERKNRLKQLKKQSLEEEKLQSRPISARRSRTQSIHFDEVLDRINTRAQDAQKRKELTKKRAQMEEESDLTFKPVINDTSRILATSVPSITSRPPSRSRSAQPDRYSFQPKIDSNSVEILRQSRHASLEETPTERADRLYREQKSRMDKQQKIKEQVEKQRQSRRPNLSEISRLIAPPSTVDDLVSDKKRKLKQQILKQRLEKKNSKIVLLSQKF